MQSFIYNHPLIKGKTMFLFDVDGTLTKPLQRLESRMIKCLTSLKKINNVYISTVGGSDYKTVKRQLDPCLPLFTYIFTENGVVGYNSRGEKFHKRNIVEYLGQNKVNNIIKFCLKYINDLDIPYKTGNFFKIRTGLINITPLGRNGSKIDRMKFIQYNNQHKILEKFKEIVENEFSLKYKVAFSIGGQTSFDCFPVGWNKTYCLRFLKDYENIIFCGDKTSKGGNDYEIFNSNKISRSYTVTGAESTITKIKIVLDDLNKLI